MSFLDQRKNTSLLSGNGLRERVIGWAKRWGLTRHLPGDEPEKAKSAMRGSYTLCKDRSLGIIQGSMCLSCQWYGGLQDSAQQCQDCGGYHAPRMTCTQALAHQYNTGETMEPEALARYRGACYFPLPRAPINVTGVMRSMVRCPIAPSKVRGADRFDPIPMDHCEECHYCAGIGDPAKVGLIRKIAGIFKDTPTRVFCMAPKNVQYHRVHTDAAPVETED